jgi:hypothetical protein
MFGKMAVVYPHCDTLLIIFHSLGCACFTASVACIIKVSLHDVYVFGHNSFIKFQLSLPVLELHCSVELLSVFFYFNICTVHFCFVYALYQPVPVAARSKV